MTNVVAEEVIVAANSSPAAATTEAQVEGPAPKRHYLPAKEAKESFDGATFSRIVHQEGRRIFRYSPPKGWVVKTGQRAEFTHGKFTATVGLAVGSNSPGKVKDNSSATAASAKNKQADAPEFEIAGQPAEKNVSTELRETGSHLRMHARSLGPDWQVEVLLEGPAEGFEAAEQQLLRTVAHISVQTAADIEQAAIEREKQTQIKIAQEKTAASRPAPTGPVRGRLE